MSKLNKSEEIKLVNRYLCNMTLLRSYGKRTDLSTLEIGLKNLETVLQEIKEQAELEKMELEEREQRRTKILEKLKEEGWTLEELLELSNKRQNSKSRKSPNKYRFIDKQGKECFWSGVGRMPLALQNLINEGQALDTFLIENVE